MVVQVTVTSFDAAMPDAILTVFDGASTAASQMVVKLGGNNAAGKILLSSGTALTVRLTSGQWPGAEGVRHWRMMLNLLLQKRTARLKANRPTNCNVK